MTKTLEFYYDFGSPNAYFAWKGLQGITERTGVSVDMRPVLLGGIFKLAGNQAPWQAYAGVTGKLEYEQLEIRRFITDYALTDFQFNSAFPVMTLLSMRVAIAAQKTGVHDAFYAPVFKAIWEQNKDISQPEVLKDVLDTAGFNGAELIEAAQTPAIKQALMDATQAASDRKIFGIPTFFWGDEIYFGKERLPQIERAIVADT